MIWIIEVLLSLWFGYEIVTLLIKDKLDAAHRLFAGVPLGYSTFSWIILFFSTKQRINWHHCFPAILILSISSIIMHKFNQKIKISLKFRINFLQALTYSVSMLIMTIILFLGMLLLNRFTCGAAYGDLPFHLNLISSFTTGVNTHRRSLFDVISPFYANEPLAYPLLTNYFTSLLMSTGFATLRGALFYPSIFMMFSLIMGIYTLSYTFTKSHLTSSFSIVFFFNLGGLGWTRILNINVFKEIGQMKYIPDWVFEWPKNRIEYWFGPIMHVLLPQRASLYSMPSCYWIIFSLIMGVQTTDMKFFILAALYTGYLPLLQVHSYVAIAQWSISFCIFTFPFLKPSKWKNLIICWIVFGVVANVMAFPQLYPYVNRVESQKNEFIQWKPIYGHRNPIVVWWYGLGAFAVIALVLGWITLNMFQVKIYSASIVVFLITNVIRYQPWEMDNIKLFYAAWIPIALPVVCQFMVILYKYDKLWILSVFLTCAICCSGFLHAFQNVLMPTQLFNQTDWDFGKWINENTPTNSTFVVNGMYHYHPVTTIGGRQIFIGYGGWTVSHGMETRTRSTINKEMSQNPYAINLFNQYNVSYIVETMNFADVYSRLAGDQWILVYNSSHYHCYKRNF